MSTKSNYTVTFGKRVWNVSATTFGLVAACLFLIAIVVVFAGAGGIWMFGEQYIGSGVLSIGLYLALFGSVTINGVRHALLPKQLDWISYLVVVPAIAYFFYNFFN